MPNPVRYLSASGGWREYKHYKTALPLACTCPCGCQRTSQTVGEDGWIFRPMCANGHGRRDGHRAGVERVCAACRRKHPPPSLAEKLGAVILIGQPRRPIECAHCRASGAWLIHEPALTRCRQCGALMPLAGASLISQLTFEQSSGLRTQ